MRRCCAWGGPSGRPGSAALRLLSLAIPVYVGGLSLMVPCRLDLVTQSPAVRRCLAAVLLREAAAAGSSSAGGKAVEAGSLLGEPASTGWFASWGQMGYGTWGRISGRLVFQVMTALPALAELLREHACW